MTSAGTVTRLGPATVQAETFSAEDAKDDEKVARAINDLRAANAQRARDWSPRWLDFEDIEVDNTGATKYTLAHHFGGRVRWWVVDHTDSAGTGGAMLERHADTTKDALVLISYIEGTVTIRVEEAG